MSKKDYMGINVQDEFIETLDVSSLSRHQYCCLVCAVTALEGEEGIVLGSPSSPSLLPLPSSPPLSFISIRE